jgi:hypothetical protein
MHPNITKMHASTLQHARFKLKTSLGVSESAYSHSEAFPIFGTGQGSTNSPIIWSMVSSKLFDVHNRKAHGASFCTPNKQLHVQSSILGFVDDSSCQTNDFEASPQPDLEDLIYKATVDAEIWATELFDSGGLLELIKCSYHLISFKFRSNGKPFMVKGEVGPAIEIPDALTGEMIPIPRKSVEEEHKTLGHYKAPCGTLPKQRQALLQAANNIAQMVLGSYLTPFESNMVYRAVFLSKFSYVLPQCHFTPNQLRTIENKAQQAFTAKCGYNRKMSLAIRYGPQRLGGAGFVQLATIQGVGQVMNFLKHWRTSTYVSSLLKCCLAWAQLNAGISEPIMLIPSLSLPHLESVFLQSTRRFLAQIDGQIEVDEPFVPPLQREYDEFLMDIALASNEFTPSELKIINYCRLRLQAVTVSDICMAQGDTLDPTLTIGDPGPYSSTSTYCDTNQDLPNKTSWIQWMRLCELVEAKLLTQPLGRWLLPADQLRREWPHYFDYVSSTLYVRSNAGFLRYTSLDSQHFSDGQPSDWRPNATTAPVGVITEQPDQYAILIPMHMYITAPPPAIPNDFQAYLQQLPPSDLQLFQSLELLVPVTTLIAALDESARGTSYRTTCKGVSDGTEVQSSMAFAWVLSDPNGRRLVQCAGPAFGSQSSSYRAEGYGIVSITKFIDCLKAFSKSSYQWRLSFAADNQGFITKVTQALAYTTPYPNVMMDSDYDLVDEVVHAVRRAQIVAEFHHVLGHQDDNTAFADLGLLSQLNVEADRLAGVFRQSHPCARPYVPRLSHNTAQLHLSGQTITRHYRSAISYQKTAPILESYMRKKFSWDPAILTSVDWRAFRRARNRMQSRQVQICKLGFDQLPTASIVSRWDSTTPSTCPRCHQAEETSDHLLRCTAPAVVAWRSQLLHDLRQLCLEQLNTRYGLVEVLSTCIAHWFQYGDLPVAPLQFPFAVQSLVQSQNAIGWRHLFRGRMSTVWAELQQSHLQMNPACRVSDTGTNWSTKVICFLWERFFLLWKSRNEVVFGDTPAESRQSSITKVLVELRQLHAKRDQYRPCDVSFLMSTEAAQDDQIFAETIRRQGVYRVQDWLETWKPFFRHSLTRAQAATRNFSTRRISEHFPVLHRPRFRPRARPPAPPPARSRVLPSPSSRPIDEYFVSRPS